MGPNDTREAVHLNTIPGNPMSFRVMTYNILAADKDVLYENWNYLKTVFMPGVPEMLTFLSQHSIAAAIVTALRTLAAVTATTIIFVVCASK